MPTPAHSPFGLDPTLAERLRAMGPVVDPDVVARCRALFMARRNVDLPASGARHYDVAYGHHSRQKLDICVTPGRDRPVVLFVPGGGSTDDKSHYLHIPSFFAREGFVGVAMNYRLASEYGWRNATSDVASALDWIADFIGDCGGDPRRIFVVAQSAGATHAALTLLDPRFRPTCHEAIRAAVLISGLYGIKVDMSASDIPHHFGADASGYEDRSPLRNIGQSRLPLTIMASELDPPLFASQSTALARKLMQGGNLPRTVLLEGHNHLSPMLNMGSEDDLLGHAMIRGFTEHL